MTSVSIFANVEFTPPDPTYGLVAKYLEDTHPDKQTLIIGAYRTEEGLPYVLPVVSKVEAMMVADKSLNHEYLPIEGLHDMSKASVKLILGANSPAIAENRAIGIQGISGTGSCRLAFEFIFKHHHVKTAYIPKPTWGNHRKILQYTGYTDIREYRYFEPVSKGLDISGLLADLEAAPEGSVIVLHGCAHNPCGVDPNKEEWAQIHDVVAKRNLFIVFDVAYQGFVSGDPDIDAWAVRYFLEKGREMFIAQSYAKNFGLYNERCGNLTMVCANSTLAMNVYSQLKAIIRPWYSNPPYHGAKIVETILNNPALYNEWKEQLKAMAERIVSMRTLFYEKLKLIKTPGDWTHILKQNGMFTFTGLKENQVAILQEKYHIYMLKSGRINMCAINHNNVDYIANAFTDVVVNYCEN